MCIGVIKQDLSERCEHFDDCMPTFNHIPVPTCRLKMYKKLCKSVDPFTLECFLPIIKTSLYASLYLPYDPEQLASYAKSDFTRARALFSFFSICCLSKRESRLQVNYPLCAHTDAFKSHFDRTRFLSVYHKGQRQRRRRLFNPPQCV